MHYVKKLQQNPSIKIWQKPKTYFQTQYIVQPLVGENNYMANYENYTPTYFINICQPQTT